MSKISGYAALSLIAPADLLAVVDVSDTSMASSGTTKKITVAGLTGTLAPSGDTSGATDLAALQSLTDALTALGGGVVGLGPGTFWVNGIYAPKSNVSVIGSGAGVTVIKLANGINSHVISNVAAISNVHLARFAVDGNKANNAAGGHNFRLSWGFSDVRLTDIYSHDASLHGIITLDDGADNNRFWVERVRSENNGVSANGSGLYLNRTFGAQITAYQGANNSLDGLQWKTGGPVQASQVVSTGNGRYGIYVTDGGTGTVTGAHISATATIGVHVQAGTGASSLILDGGFVELGQVDGIRLDGVANCILANLLVRNNNKSAATNAGLRFVNAVSYSRITNCSFYDDQGTHTQKYGIWAATGTGASDHIKIHGCDTRGNVTASFQQDSWGANNTVVDLSAW